MKEISTERKRNDFPKATELVVWIELEPGDKSQ